MRKGCRSSVSHGIHEREAFQDGLAHFKQTEGISLKRRRDESSNEIAQSTRKILKRFAADTSAIQAEILSERENSNGYTQWLQNVVNDNRMLQVGARRAWPWSREIKIAGGKVLRRCAIPPQMTREILPCIWRQWWKTYK